MNEMIAYCGLNCDTCPIHQATLQTNRELQAKMRAEIAKLCREQYEMEYSLENITDCDGCRKENGRLFSGCRTCEIRKCAGERKVENCAYCTEYACQILKAFLFKEPAAKSNLEKIRSKMN